MASLLTAGASVTSPAAPTPLRKVLLEIVIVSPVANFSVILASILQMSIFNLMLYYFRKGKNIGNREKYLVAMVGDE